MSTQAYYKDRLGFDPREALYDTAPVNSPASNNNHSSSRGVKSSSRHSRKETYSNSHHHQQQHQHHHHRHSTSSSSQQQYHHRHQNSASPERYVDSPSKKQKQQQDGYEDALTQFKGTMSVWEYFVENLDYSGESVVCVVYASVSVFFSAFWCDTLIFFVSFELNNNFKTRMLLMCYCSYKTHMINC